MTDEKPLEPADTVIGHIVRDAMWDAQMDVTDRARLNALVQPPDSMSNASCPAGGE